MQPETVHATTASILFMCAPPFGAHSSSPALPARRAEVKLCGDLSLSSRVAGHGAAVLDPAAQAIGGLHNKGRSHAVLPRQSCSGGHPGTRARVGARPARA